MPSRACLSGQPCRARSPLRPRGGFSQRTARPPRSPRPPRPPAHFSPWDSGPEGGVQPAAPGVAGGRWVAAPTPHAHYVRFRPQRPCRARPTAAQSSEETRNPLLGAPPPRSWLLGAPSLILGSRSLHSPPRGVGVLGASSPRTVSDRAQPGPRALSFATKSGVLGTHFSRRTPAWPVPTPSLIAIDDSSAPPMSSGVPQVRGMEDSQNASPDPLLCAGQSPSPLP